MPFHEIDQRTTEWHTLRLGKPTASCFKNLMTKDKSRFQDRKGEWLEVMWHWPQMPKSYAARLVAERIIGEPQDGLYAPEDEEDPFGESEDNNLPAAVARGRRLEGDAIQEFCATTGLSVSDGGFYTDDTGRYGASPDGNTSDGGILEVKCYDVVKHIKTILNDGPLEEDIPQIQGELLVSGKPHCHFYLYHPELPAAHFIVRPDHAYQEMLLQALNIFCNGVDYAYTILTKPKRK